MGGRDLQESGGVKPMNISGRLIRERERLAGMTDEERLWRRQWLKDQILSPNEPRYVPEYWKHRMNPIRRIYTWPLDKVFTLFNPVLGAERSARWRFFTGKWIMVAYGAMAIHYYFKYNQNDWTTKSGWRVVKSRAACVPGAENFPSLPNRTKHSEYASRGFENSAI